MKSCSSIFNDVIGPVMTGPSSSHTAGCARIGRMTRLLYGRDISRAEIIFDEQGSYVSTYIGQGSNYGFAGGLMGFAPEDYRLKDAITLAHDEGREFVFKKADINAGHPNEARINILEENGELAMTVLTRSVGGGMFEIIEMDGFLVDIKGDRESVFIAADRSAAEEIASLFCHVPIKTETKDNTVLFTIDDVKKLSDTSIEEAEKNTGVRYVRRAEIILPAAVREKPNPPFINAGEAMCYAAEHNCSLWELAVHYETGVVDITPEGIFEKGYGILRAMRKSSAIYKPEEVPTTGFLGPQAYSMAEKMKKRKIADAGILNRGMLWAVAVMENNCIHNIVVAAPTAGSCGVIPAAIVAAGEDMGLSDEQIVKGLLVSGLVGAFIANQATFGAEVAACQAENGAASAMAAAGVAQLLEASVEEGFNAASIAMQNLLGLICDPVGGLTETPCISRNVAALSNAVMSANMALCGFDGFIPLDEVIQTMMTVGKMLPREFRCTCEGGLCSTPTAERIDAELKLKRETL
ncbi:L-serine dehydratase, alpha chain [Clostridiales bacterium]|nr:L-serine dehydratase, alpha chain [Clostridiales bacterium]